jgi:hypothetical protein
MDDIVNLFTKEHGIYKKIFKFQVLIVLFIILLFLTKLDLFRNNSVYILLSIVLAIYVTNMYVKINQNDLSDNNKIIHLKLDTLQSKVYQYVKYKIITSSASDQKLSQNDIQTLYEKNKLNALYIDANMITFLHSILTLSEYNPQEFYLLLKGTNNILKLRYDIERFYSAEGKYPENIHEMLQVALQLKSNSMNNLQNFIYTVPKQNQMYTYVDNVLETYNILITRNVKAIHTYHLDYIKKNGINSNTIFIDINSSKPFDSTVNRSVIPSKEGLKHSLIDLYV